MHSLAFALTMTTALTPTWAGSAAEAKPSVHAQPLTVLDRANQIESIGQENLHPDLESALTASQFLHKP